MNFGILKLLVLMDLKPSFSVKKLLFAPKYDVDLINMKSAQSSMGLI
jgi:hypothetical protein